MSNACMPEEEVGQAFVWQDQAGHACVWENSGMQLFFSARSSEQLQAATSGLSVKVTEE